MEDNLFRRSMHCNAGSFLQQQFKDAAPGLLESGGRDAQSAAPAGCYTGAALLPKSVR